MTKPLRVRSPRHGRKRFDEELNQLLHHKTWEDCNEIPKGVKPIQCRWVFKTKHEPDGNVRHKARLVVKGYTQRKGLDYQETYAPVVRADTLRLLLGLSIYDRDIQVHVMDVVTAFLNGRIKERIYMEVPQGYKSKAQCVRLLGSLYGLKQALSVWHKTIESYLIDEMKFKQIKSTSCLYIKRNDHGLFVMIALYVDDISLAGHSEMIEATKAMLKERFQMKDLGPITQVVGIEVHHNPKQGDMFLCQKKYIESMLRMNGMENCSTGPTPLPFGSKLTMTPPGQKDRIQLDYRKAVGQLLHLLSTRPDIHAGRTPLARYP